MAKCNDLPIIIGKGHRKGIFGYVDKGCRAVVNIVWLKKDIDHGKDFELEDIDKLNATLWFCDRESVDQTITVLEKLREGMVKDEND